MDSKTLLLGTWFVVWFVAVCMFAAHAGGGDDAPLPDAEKPADPRAWDRQDYHLAPRDQIVFHDLPAEAAKLTDLPPRDRYLAALDLGNIRDRDIHIFLARRDYVEDLLKRYGPPGTRQDAENLERGPKYAFRSIRLFRELNPIGFTGADMRALLGEPARVERPEWTNRIYITYTFTRDHGGIEWRIGLSGTTVESIDFNF